MPYPISLGAPRARNNPPSYLGNTRISVTSIDMGGSIDTRETTDTAPMALIASAANVTYAGSRLGSSHAINPYLDLEHRFSIEKLGGARCEYGDEIEDPVQNAIIDPYAEQISPEGTFLLREAGTYTLTLTSTGLDASGDPISNTITETITVTENTSEHQFVDGLNGDNANDGRDPFGFPVTAGVYTESTKSLVEVGAFAAYDHAAATAGLSTNHYNFIYINSHGWQRIASKVSDDEITLVVGLGSDQAGLTTSTGPLASYDADYINNTIHHFRGNQGVSEYERSDRFEIRSTTGTVGVVAYDGDEVRFYPAATPPSRLFSNFTGASSSAPDKVILSNITMDGDNRCQVMGGASTSSNIQGMRLIMDRVVAKAPPSSNGLVIQNSNTASSYFDVILWGTKVENEDVAGESRANGIYNEDGPLSRFRMIGGYITGSAESSLLDHYHYENSSGNHRHLAYIYYKDGVNYNYCININRQLAGECRYYSLHDCWGGGDVNWFCDGSYTHNDPSIAWFRDVYIRGNFAETNQGWMLSYCNKEYFAADNMYIGGFNEMFRAGDAPEHVDSEFWYAIERNKTYTCGIEENRYADPRMIYDNYVYDTNTTASVIELDESLLSGADILYDNNICYAPNDIDGDIVLNRDGFTYSSLATFDATHSFSNTYADPEFLDPANADFRILGAGGLLLSISGIPDGDYYAIAYRQSLGQNPEDLYKGTVSFSSEEGIISVTADSGDVVFTDVMLDGQNVGAIARNEVV